MAQHLSLLCFLLIQDTYGDLPAQIFKILTQRGRTPLATLIQHSPLSSVQLRHGLTVLIQQHLVRHFSQEGEGIAFYEADWDGAYNLLRTGRIITIVEDRYGSGASQVISNLLQLGHARVGDLEDAYKFAPKEHSAVDAAAEHINGEGLQSGMERGQVISKGQDRKITTRAHLHSVLYRLLEHGFITRVRKHNYYSASDTHNEAELRVKREQFPDGKVTGPKAKIAFTREVNSLKRKWRDEGDTISGDMYKGTAKKVNGRSTKRQKLNGNMSSHQSYEDEDFDVSLEREIVLKVNYVKFDVAMRSLQLERFATRFFDDSTAKVYGTLLVLLERKLHRCRDDLKKEIGEDEDEADSYPTCTSLEVTDELDPTLDLTSTIANSAEDGLPNGWHDEDNPKVKKEMRNDDDGYGPSSIKEHNKRLTLVDQHLRLLAEHSRGFVERVGSRGKGEWRVHYKDLIKACQNAEIENMISARFGTVGARLVRMLSKKGKLEEKQVCAYALLRAKDVRAVLTEMQEAGLAETQEVPKENSRQPSRSIYLWYFNHERCGPILLGDTYKAMCRLIQRIEVQRDTVKDVIEKAERLDVVGHEDQYLTPSDKNYLRRWRETEEKLLTQLNRQDDMVALLRDF